MKTIINWTAGSFFRSIGRVIAYIVIGCFIAYILNRSGFDWGGLIGIEKVSALSFSTDIKQVDSTYLDWSNIANQNEWTATDSGYTTRIQTNSNNDVNYKYIELVNKLDTTTVDYVAIPFMSSQPIRNLQTNTLSFTRCVEWGLESNGDYYCMDGQIDSTTINVPYTTNVTSMNFYFTVTYFNDNDEWYGWNSCDYSDGMILCPTIHRKIKYIYVHYNFNAPETTYSTIFIGGGLRFYNFNDTTTAIHEQTQQQQQQYNDTNTTTESNATTSFFQNQQDETPSALTSAITSPLRIINNAIQGTHSSLCFTLNSKQTCIPSGDLIWGSTGSYNQHHWFDSGQFNPKVTFISFFNVVVAGYLCYKMLLSMMRIFNNAIDPTVTKIEVMKL